MRRSCSSICPDFTSFAETARPASWPSCWPSIVSSFRRRSSDHGGTVDQVHRHGSWRYSGNRGPGETTRTARSMRARSGRRAQRLEESNVERLLGPPCCHWPALRHGSRGVLDNSCHSEFTVIGDAGYVAQRAGNPSEFARSSLGISSDLVVRLQAPVPDATWMSLRSALCKGEGSPSMSGICSMLKSPTAEHRRLRNGRSQTARQRWLSNLAEPRLTSVCE